MAAVRAKIVDYLKNHILGPVGGERETIPDRPYDRYLSGMLFPQQADQNSDVEAEPDELGVKAISDRYDNELSDADISGAQSQYPSCVGLSFFVSAGTLECTATVSAALYEKAPSDIRWTKPDGYRRQPLQAEEVELEPRMSSTKVLDGRASLVVVPRKVRGGWVCTVALKNERALPGTGSIPVEDCLYQVTLEVSIKSGEVTPYPSGVSRSIGAEERELEMLFKDSQGYAVGHGAAANWHTSPEGRVLSISVDYVPAVEVVATSASIPEGYDIPPNALDPGWLASETTSDSAVLGALSGLVESYRMWLQNERSKAAVEDAEVAASVLDRIETSAHRMEEGVERLRDPIAMKAFRLAQLAMLIQRRRSEHDLAGEEHKLGGVPDSLQQLDEADYIKQAQEQAQPFRWWPFQVGFFLQTLDSLCEGEHPEDDVVDLLWFPTGGGKTEAYLLIACFVLFYRRLRYGDFGSGTAILSRYTLRLLATQQFLRTATVISACEFLRRRRTEELGADPFSVGLWAGGDVTPNRYRQAHAAVVEMSKSPDAKNRFQLGRCPWCGTRLREGTEVGFESSETSLRVFCRSQLCEYHTSLPVALIDDEVYAQSSSIIVGTVDKFAQLVWQEAAGAVLGSEKKLPPSLVLQDELHLISGPLGTIYALYEAGIEEAISLRAKRLGVVGHRPKLIASTATVRSAGLQIRSLYNRAFAVFPPPGIRESDSFFAWADRTRAGRLFLGVLPQKQRGATAQYMISAWLAQAPLAIGIDDRESLDPYATQMVYCSSIRALGQAMALAGDDTPGFLEKHEPLAAKRRRLTEPMELSSRMSEDDESSFRRLERRMDDHNHAWICGCTNRFATGIDIPRLGLMLCIGQPKSTNEYIQATSRVGRSKNSPGVVVTLLSGSHPRDRSHYETFRQFHQAMYRFVEPTSVTPFAAPARERALHAALVLAFRCGLPNASNDGAARFGKDDLEVRGILERLGDRCAKVDPRESDRTREHLDKICSEWAGAVAEHEQALRYSAENKALGALLQQFEESEFMHGLWPTLGNMRNVDAECVVWPLGRTRKRMDRDEAKINRVGVRRGQSLAPFGSGAVYSVAEQSFAGLDPGAWGVQGVSVDLRRLSSAMNRFAGVPRAFELVMPPPAPEYTENDFERGVNYVRFPQWMFCPSCRKLACWNPENERSMLRPSCRECSTNKYTARLVPMRFILICEEGHLSDIDWRVWAHSGSNKTEFQRQCESADLEYIGLDRFKQLLTDPKARIESDKGDSEFVVCRTCKAGRSIRQILNSNHLSRAAHRGKRIKCSGSQPGFRELGRFSANCPSDDDPKLLHVSPRNASRIWYPRIASALDIPPDSDNRYGDRLIDDLKRTPHWRATVCDLESGDRDQYKASLEALTRMANKKNAAMKGIQPDQLTEGERIKSQDLDRVLCGRGGLLDESLDLMSAEYRALLHGEAGNPLSSSFVTRSSDFGDSHWGDLELQALPDSVIRSLRGAIEDVVVVEKLREVRALYGFSRWGPGSKPVMLWDLNGGDPRIPASEVFGEGIFIKFNERAVASWEHEHSETLEAGHGRLMERWNKSYLAVRSNATAELSLDLKPSSRGVMLHTLSHLLMRQLCFSCGYSTTSLRERVYSRPAAEGEPMAGILIYTAEPDSEGTMGGLARVADRVRFVPQLLEALTRARWCSNDPVCSEVAVQGIDGLNGAACHSCCLVPEPSCMASNALLDRQLVIGAGVGVFEPVLRSLEDA